MVSHTVVVYRFGGELWTKFPANVSAGRRLLCATVTDDHQTPAGGAIESPAAANALLATGWQHSLTPAFCQRKLNFVRAARRFSSAIFAELETEQGRVRRRAADTRKSYALRGIADNRRVSNSRQRRISPHPQAPAVFLRRQVEHIPLRHKSSMEIPTPQQIIAGVGARTCHKPFGALEISNG